MSKKNLRENMAVLLKEGVTDAERQFLEDMGFKMKKPNKYTVIAAALYKKAAAGDLSAIKELRSLQGDGSPDGDSLRLVRIIDDIRG